LRTRQLLRTLRHRAITPVSSRVLGTFKIARVTGQFIVRLKLFSNGNCPLDWNTNPMFYANQLPQKIFSLIQVRNRGWATGQFPPEIFKIMFSCYVQQQVAIILPLTENCSWFQPLSDMKYI